MEVDDFVSEKALVVMEKSLLQKDFIEERGFNNLISPFREVIEKRGWSLLSKHKPIGFAAIVIKQEGDQQGLQYERMEGWIQVQEAVEGAKQSEDC